ncbi:MAG: aminotransferase class I/II-fold pyridoxal phosphate-dependent enzyme [Alphaproteobacteria bacterium]|nr:aminotransferase class I/II-fold pyridoxal phosphate-dependent enzyme [Alphaproteobacteria bacterium]
MADACAGLQEPVTSCPAAPSQAAALAALQGDQTMVGAFRDTFRRRRDILAEVFAGTGLVPNQPAGAFYALIDISRSGMTSIAFAKALLAERGVALVPGSTFGPSCDRYVRVAFTIADDKLREGLVRLRDRILGNARV